MHVYTLGCVRLFTIFLRVACQAPLSMGFSRQEYWSGLLFATPGDLPDPGMEPVSLASPALAGRFFTAASGKPRVLCTSIKVNTKLYRILPDPSC